MAELSELHAVGEIHKQRCRTRITAASTSGRNGWPNSRQRLTAPAMPECPRSPPARAGAGRSAAMTSGRHYALQRLYY